MLFKNKKTSTGGADTFNAGPAKDMEMTSLENLKMLANAIDIKMGFKPGRTRRVVDITREMLIRMHKDQATIDKICELAWIHDVGMLFVPEEIITKPGELTEEEKEKVREHILKGEELAAGLTHIPDAGRIIRAHHERYDGKGFPDGLEEKAIPFEARVLAIADAYVSMTSKRPYHDIFTKGKARGEIIANKVSQFDPVAADALIEMIDEDIDYQLKEN